jgi:hypothetical protein
VVDELDASIVRVLNRELPKSVYPAQVSISFAAPDAQFPPDSLTLPAINFFLYDLRQNFALHRNDPVIERTENGSVRRAPAPIVMNASYLVTVWTDEQKPIATAEEHRIFTALLQVLMAYSTFQPEDLGDTMKKLSPPTCVVGGGMLQTPGQAWQALAGRQKLSTTYTVTFEMPVLQPEEITLVTDKRLEFGLLKDGDVIEKELSRRTAPICGTVFDRAGRPAASAPVWLNDASGATIQRTVSRADGSYYFLDVPDGEYLVSASYLSATAQQAGTVSRDAQGDLKIEMVDLRLAGSQ